MDEILIVLYLYCVKQTRGQTPVSLTKNKKDLVYYFTTCKNLSGRTRVYVPKRISFMFPYLYNPIL